MRKDCVPAISTEAGEEKDVCFHFKAEDKYWPALPTQQGAGTSAEIARRLHHRTWETKCHTPWLRLGSLPLCGAVSERKRSVCIRAIVWVPHTAHRMDRWRKMLMYALDFFLNAFHVRVPWFDTIYKPTI